MKKKDIKPYNNRWQPHGYWENYWMNGNLCYKSVYINGKKNGFNEWHSSDGKLTVKNYYL